MKKLIFSFLWMLALAASAVAQSKQAGSFTIKGQVVDSLSNEGVSYATLSITSASNPKEAPVLLACDIDGNFQAAIAEAGAYNIVMQSVGKQTVRRKVSLASGKPEANLGKLYMADDNKVLGEVTVSAQKPLVKVDIDKLVYSMDDDPEAKVNNTLEMLRKVPMVTVDGEDNIQLKGSSNFKIYMNGKPSGLLSNNPSEVLKSMPASSVKNIEVITDPGAKYDAEGVGGIINIITVRNVLQGYTGSVSAGASVRREYEVGAFVSARIGKLGLTANYNYEYENGPWMQSEAVRENLVNDANRFLNQIGKNKEKGYMQHGYLEGSYEIDSLNLLTIGANLFRRKENVFAEYNVTMRNLGQELVYSYDRNSETSPVFGSAEVNVDYQHSTQKKGELLTFSYRFGNTPRDDESLTDLFGTFNYYDLRQWDINKAKTNEHTAQLDYVTPTWAGQELEVGAKYILRQSDSETIQRLFNDSTSNWTDISSANSNFKHSQHIYSAYAGYSARIDKVGLKAGVRAEGTSLRVSYAKAPEQNFGTDYFDVVPNATISYQLSQTQQLRMGYNMRIQRAGIRHLNPYVNSTDPLNISYGNPDLNSEKSNSINMNYSLFGQAFSLNASLSYTFVNNSIEQYTFINPDFPGVSRTTYGNIGKRQQTGLFLYANWNPVPIFRIFMNGGFDYTDLTSETNDMANSGISGRLFAGAQLTLPKDFRVNLNGGYFSPSIQLQGKRSPFFFTGVTLNKDFMKKKLTVSLACQSPFWNNRKMETTSSDATFRMRNTDYHPMRDFSITISYRFGTLKEQFKKAQRGIVNDDVINGGSGNTGGAE